VKRVREQHWEKRCPRTISPPPPAIAISTPRDIMVTFPTHLSSPTMATALELMSSHLPSSPETRPPPLLGVLVPVLCWHPLIEFGSPPYPELPLHLVSDFARSSESFSLRSQWVLRCRTLGRTRPRLARLVPLMGKASVCNITVPLSFVVCPKALAMARLSVVDSPLVILPLPPSQFCPLALYCPFS